MGYIQKEKCKTCKNWGYNEDCCWMQRGGFCPDFSSGWQPEYSALMDKVKELEGIIKKLKKLDDSSLTTCDKCFSIVDKEDLIDGICFDCKE